MSAWIVSKAHIDALVQGGVQVRIVGPEVDRTVLGQMLWLANHKSVNHRYSESTQPPGYRFVAAEFALNLWGLLKTVDCYVYQSCEPPGWKDSEAADYCRRLNDAICDRLEVPADEAHQHAAYGTAPWGIESVTDIALAPAGPTRLRRR